MSSQQTSMQEPSESGSKQTDTTARTTRAKKSASAFRTISEVAKELDVQQHVLRFWETKFSQIRPLKRGGGRRYYRPEDIELLKRIHTLLYSEGYTIKGVQKLLREQGKNEVLNGAGLTTAAANTDTASAPKPVAASSDSQRPANSGGLSGSQRQALEGMLSELKALRKLVAGS